MSLRTTASTRNPSKTLVLWLRKWWHKTASSPPQPSVFCHNTASQPRPPKSSVLAVGSTPHCGRRGSVRCCSHRDTCKPTATSTGHASPVQSRCGSQRLPSVPRMRRTSHVDSSPGKRDTASRGRGRTSQPLGHRPWHLGTRWGHPLPLEWARNPPAQALVSSPPKSSIKQVATSGGLELMESLVQRTRLRRDQLPSRRVSNEGSCTPF